MSAGPHSAIGNVRSQRYVVRYPVRPHTFLQIDHEIVSTVSFSLPLIQEGQLSATGEGMGNDYSLTA